MKLIKYSLALLFTVFSVVACNTKAPEIQEAVLNFESDVQVFYFHNTKRCVTCNAVEDETRLVLEMFFEKELEKGTLEFTSLNLEEEEGRKMAEALGVSGQTLLLVKGDTKVNLTNEGFMNARKNPGAFHEVLQEQLGKLI